MGTSAFMRSKNSETIQ